MQGKNYTLFKLIASLLIIACAITLQSKEKPSQPNDKNDNSKPKEAIIFDSCGKDTSEKCEKETEISVPDYSKSLK